MDTSMPNDPQFNEHYRKHLQYLKLAGLQPKTIEASSWAIRRIGNYFDSRVENLITGQLLDRHLRNYLGRCLLYMETGLVQQTVQIVVRCAHTI